MSRRKISDPHLVRRNRFYIYLNDLEEHQIFKAMIQECKIISRNTTGAYFRDIILEKSQEILKKETKVKTEVSEMPEVKDEIPEIPS